jgi:hypothetical protein
MENRQDIESSPIRAKDLLAPCIVTLWGVLLLALSIWVSGLTSGSVEIHQALLSP